MSDSKLYGVTVIDTVIDRRFNTKNEAVAYCRSRFSEDLDYLINYVKEVLPNYKENRDDRFGSKYNLLKDLAYSLGCRYIDVLNELKTFKERELQNTDVFTNPFGDKLYVVQFNRELIF